MGAQPVGATGVSLGAIGLVSLQVQMGQTIVCKQVPCHVFESEKPMWQGELSRD